MGGGAPKKWLCIYGPPLKAIFHPKRFCDIRGNNHQNILNKLKSLPPPREEKNRCQYKSYFEFRCSWVIIIYSENGCGESNFSSSFWHQSLQERWPVPLARDIGARMEEDGESRNTLTLKTPCKTQVWKIKVADSVTSMKSPLPSVCWICQSWSAPPSLGLLMVPFLPHSLFSFRALDPGLVSLVFLASKFFESTALGSSFAPFPLLLRPCPPFCCKSILVPLFSNCSDCFPLVNRIF